MRPIMYMDTSITNKRTGSIRMALEIQLDKCILLFFSRKYTFKELLDKKENRKQVFNKISLHVTYSLQILKIRRKIVYFYLT